MPDELLIHSYKGTLQYRQPLKEEAIIQSISRKGNFYDNPVMKNYLGMMNSEFLYLHKFKNIDYSGKN
ncbi:hypothetical protein MHB85_00975 [Paenibacillus sp. FSL K6-4396]|uniref:hypothetical protein n=1 Tax=Paenibacillus sp. FSL K6-4396 TaxID=2921506 RepID=UPI0030F6CDE0